MKKEKGITLIALIITIIVMLILVGVTVTVALNGGLFTTTKQAADRTTEEKEKEIIQVAYSDYNMQKYSSQDKKTADFDLLEEFFIGKDINSLINEEKSVNGEVCFEDKDKGISIVILEEKDLEVSEDEKYMYMYFEYNDNKYKLICDYNSTIAQKLEVMPKLYVQDAVVNEEIDGWNIVFNASGNTYDLLEDGRIMNRWWKLTEEEKNQMKDDSLESGLLLIAENSNVKIGLGTVYGDESNSSGIGIVVEGNDKTIIYYFTMTEKMSEFIEENSNPKVEVNLFKWYKGENTGENFKEYSDVSPISLDDFTDEQIYCRSYLERIINSFNK